MPTVESISTADDVPIGTILPWAKNLTGTPALPTGWQLCDGSTINDSESVYDGVAVPDLNGSGYFLKGSNVSGNTGGTQNQTADYTLGTGINNSSVTGGSDFYIGDGATSGAYTTSTFDNRPPFYAIVFIIKIK